MRITLKHKLLLFTASSLFLFNPVWSQSTYKHYDFGKIDSSLQSVTSEQRAVNDSLMSVIVTLKSKNPALYAKACKLDSMCSNHIIYLVLMKINLIDQAGGFDKESGDLVKREDIDIVTNYLIEKPNGDTLMMQREGLRSFMTSVCNSAETNKYIDSSFMLTQGNTNDGKRLSYIYLYFYHTQVLIANTYLSRFEDNCARCETLVLKNIISQF